MNRRAYDASLRQRGSLTVWFMNEAIEGWRAESCTIPGGQPWQSTLAILTALTLWAVFLLALRQTEGRIGSVIGLLGLSLAMLDHTFLVRSGRDAGGATTASASFEAALSTGACWYLRVKKVRLLPKLKG